MNKNVNVNVKRSPNSLDIHMSREVGLLFTVRDSYESRTMHENVRSRTPTSLDIHTGGPIDFKRKCGNPTVGCGVSESPIPRNPTDPSWIPQYGNLRWAIICGTKFLSSNLNTKLPWQRSFIFVSRQGCIQILWHLQNKKLGTTNYCSTLNLPTAGFRKDLWNLWDSVIPTPHSPLWDSCIFVWSRSGPLSHVKRSRTPLHSSWLIWVTNDAWESEKEDSYFSWHSHVKRRERVLFTFAFSFIVRDSYVLLLECEEKHFYFSWHVWRERERRQSHKRKMHINERTYESRTRRHIRLKNEKKTHKWEIYESRRKIYINERHKWVTNQRTRK